MEPADRAADGGLGRLTRRFGRLAPLVALAIVTTACTTHDVTRQPASDMGSRWALFWLAAVALGVVSVAIVVTRARPVRPRRVVAAAPFLAAGVAAMIGSLLLFGIVARRSDALNGGPCRQLPAAERPEAYIAITCSNGSDVEGPFAVILVLPAVAATILGLLALKGDRGFIWLPAGVAVAVAAAGAWGAATSAHDKSDGTFISSAVTFVTGAVPAAALAPELLKRR